MKSKAQEWFLVKKNWMEELEDLTDTEFGTLIRSLYYSQCPEGSQRVLYRTLKDEFDRINENREEGLKKRREASAKANALRSKTIPDVAQWAPRPVPVVHRTHTHTHTHTHTQTPTDGTMVVNNLKDKKEYLINLGLYSEGMKTPSSYSNREEYIEHQYELNYKN